MIPRMMEITTKIGCPLNCRFCPQDLLIRSYHLSEKNSALMSFETFKICIDKIPADVDIHFSGMAEPWINSECTKMLIYAYDKGHRIYIFTTLVGMTQTDFYKIKDMNIERFVLHIPDEENNSKFILDTSYMSLLEEVVANSINGKFKIDHFSCHGNVHPKIKDLIESSGLKVDSNMYDRAGNVQEKCDIDSGNRKSGPIICKFCNGTALDKNVLLPDGQVLLCCMDYGMKFPLGNLKHQSFDEISEGPQKTKYRDMMMHDNYADSILCRICHRSKCIDNTIPVEQK